MLSLPAFLVTDHERMYTLAFWAKATGGDEGAVKPRPHVTFQDEDADYGTCTTLTLLCLLATAADTTRERVIVAAWISGEHVQLSAFWHQYQVRARPCPTWDP